MTNSEWNDNSENVFTSIAETHNARFFNFIKKLCKQKYIYYLYLKYT